MEPQGFYHNENNLPFYHNLNHKDAVHIFITSSIWSTLLLSYNLCPISHKPSLPLGIPFVKFLYLFNNKSWSLESPFHAS
jgi:hypothetical protein